MYSENWKNDHLLNKSFGYYITESQQNSPLTTLTENDNVYKKIV